MFDRKTNKACAQTTLEYAVVIAVIVAALVSMQVYIKRSLQGKLRAVADDIGRQYDPQNTTGNFTIELSSNITTKVENEEEVNEEEAEERRITTTVTTVTTNSQVERRYGDETVGELDSSL